VGYDSRSRTLEIEFHHTGVYQHYDVPKTVLEEMLAQNSLGAYFNLKIRDFFACAGSMICLRPLRSSVELAKDVESVANGQISRLERHSGCE
jgi:hypothetical protein